MLVRHHRTGAVPRPRRHPADLSGPSPSFDHLGVPKRVGTAMTNFSGGTMRYTSIIGIAAALAGGLLLLGSGTLQDAARLALDGAGLLSVLYVAVLAGLTVAAAVPKPADLPTDAIATSIVVQGAGPVDGSPTARPGTPDRPDTADAPDTGPIDIAEFAAADAVAHADAPDTDASDTDADADTGTVKVGDRG
ncbi:MAG: hypothetical protein QG622_3554 [Actinomycetota bacterium]|nr:hypothetical protein [Actinomycetota bacterium]